MYDFGGRRLYFSLVVFYLGNDISNLVFHFFGHPSCSRSYRSFRGLNLDYCMLGCVIFIVNRLLDWRFSFFQKLRLGLRWRLCDFFYYRGWLDNLLNAIARHKLAVVIGVREFGAISEHKDYHLRRKIEHLEGRAFVSVLVRCQLTKFLAVCSSHDFKIGCSQMLLTIS